MLHNNPPYCVRIPHTIEESPKLYKNSFSGESKSCPSESKPCPNESGSCPSESESCPSGSEPFPSESESGRGHYMRIPQTIYKNPPHYVT